MGGDWGQEATITQQDGGSNRPAIELSRDDLVAEIGEQALGRLLAEKQLAVVGRAALGVKAAIEREKATAEKAKAEAEKAVKAAEEKVKAAESKVAEIKASCDGLSRKNTEQAKALNELRKELDGLKAELRKARTDAATASESVAELQSKLRAETTARCTAEADLVGARQTLADRDATIKELVGQVDSLKQQLAEATAPKKQKRKK